MISPTRCLVLLGAVRDELVEGAPVDPLGDQDLFAAQVADDVGDVDERVARRSGVAKARWYWASRS